MGSYSASGASTTSCTPCPPGTYNHLTGQGSCIQCSAGFYNPRYGSRTVGDCNPCPVGSYSTLAGSPSVASCTICPLGTTTLSANSNSPSACVACPIGSCAAAVSLSNYLANASSVTMSVSFVVSTFLNAQPIRSVLISGLRLSPSNDNFGSVTCRNIPLSNVSSIVQKTSVASIRTLLLQISNPTTVPISQPILCQVFGVSNAVAGRSSRAFVKLLSTVDSSYFTSSYLWPPPPTAFSFSSTHSSCSNANGAMIDGNGGWCTANGGIGTMTIDAGYVRPITGVATQGRSDADQWATKFDIATSTDGSIWATAGLQYPGNTNRNSVVRTLLSPAVDARYVRITVTAWNGHSSMRAGLLEMADSNQLQTQEILFPEVLNRRVVSSMSPAMSPSTAHVLVSVSGTGAGLSDWSGRIRIGVSACASSIWLNDNVIACRVSSVSFRTVHALASVLLNLGSLTNAVSYTPSSASSVSQLNTPSSGGAIVALISRNWGFHDRSGAIRFAMTACSSTRWLSDSLLRLRFVGGSAQPDRTVSVSYDGNRRTTSSTLLNYDLPSILNAPSKVLSNISVTGANFGPFLAVAERLKECPNIQRLSKNSSKIEICRSSMLNTQEAGITVAETDINFVFSNVSRLDDVVVFLKSPTGIEHTIMRNKCYGSMPCLPNVVNFTFQILPSLPSMAELPVALCPASGIFVPDRSFAAALRQQLQSQTAMGDWTLHVSTGSENQILNSAFIRFKTATLNFRIGVTSAASILWTSDSSTMMSAPGLQSHALESSSGWGRSRSFAVQTGGLQSNSNYPYSYPDPVVTHTNDTLRNYIPTGTTSINLFGRYFSNSASTHRVRVGLTVCSASLWYSDTAVTSRQLPSLQDIRAFALTIDRSAVAHFTSKVSFVPSISAFSNSTEENTLFASTAATAISLVGSGFGVWGFSARFRLPVGMSSAEAVFWRSNTHISSKVAPRGKNPGIHISLGRLVYADTIIWAKGIFPIINSYHRFNIPSTGAIAISVTGSSYGLYSVSARSSLRGSASQETFWTADSIIRSKMPSGLRFTSGSHLAISAVRQVSITYVSEPKLVYNFPTVNSSASLLSNGTALFSPNQAGNCIFNDSASSMCATGHLFQMISSSSGYGIHNAAPSMAIQIVQGQGRSVQSCDRSLWVSDSAMYCLFTQIILKDNYNISVMITSGVVTIRNTFFVPASPEINSDTMKIRVYSGTSIPSQSLGYFGSSSEFVWPASNVSNEIKFSESLTFSIVVFLNASQYFLDFSFNPIATKIEAIVTVRNQSADVTALVLCSDDDATSTQFNLGPISFWTQRTMSLTFCTPKELEDQELFLSVSISAQNVRRQDAIILSHISNSFFGKIEGLPRLVLTSHLAAPSQAALTYDDAMTFRFYFDSRLDDVCEQGKGGYFSYSLSLHCTNSNGTRNHTLFRHHGQVLSQLDVPRSTFCLLSTKNLSYIQTSPNCSFVLFAGVPRGTFVSQESEFFAVVPGLASVANLVGSGPFCSSAGAPVWSVNDTFAGDLLCLLAQLTDNEGNNIRSIVSANVTARSNSSLRPYIVNGQVSAASNTSGVVTWCEIYTSRTQQEGVVFGVSVNGKETFWDFTVINVSSIGPASVMVPMNLSAIHNETLFAGKGPPKITFAIQDFGGNPVSGATNVAIRVRVVQTQVSSFRSAMDLGMNLTSPTQRRLLQSSSWSNLSCASYNPITHFVLSNGSSEIEAGAELICREGLHKVIFDVGSIFRDSFSLTRLSVFHMNISVQPGLFTQLVLLPFPSKVSVKTYELIKSLEVLFIDDGLNEVSGEATLSLTCINKLASIFPSDSFRVSSNVSTSIKAIIPPFFIYKEDWLPSGTLPAIIVGTANSSVPNVFSTVAHVELESTCSPGYRIRTPPLQDLLQLLRSDLGNLSVSRISCEVCNSVYYDAPQCITLRWNDLPTLVQSGLDINVDGVNIIDETSEIFRNVGEIIMTASMIGQKNSTSNSKCSAVFVKGVSKGCKIAAATYDQIPSRDHKWLFEFSTKNEPDIVLTSFLMPQNGNITALDWGSFIEKAVPDRMSFAGNSIITLTGVFPNVTGSYVLGNTSVPVLRNHTCVFTSSQRLLGNTSIVVPAKLIEYSNISIKFACASLPPGLSGPPFTQWTPIMHLADGRNSTGVPKTLESFCSPGFYIHTDSSHQICRACPAARSTTISDNMPAIQSCMCNQGYYGTFGDGCIACPKNVEGFNCSQLNQSVPRIEAGFYIDYAKLKSCSEYGPKCPAIIRCPNPSACPGTREKECFKSEKHCYDSESFGCTSCCYRYYMENLKCYPCPPSQLPLLLGLATLALILFAIFSSSFDFPPMISVAKSLKVFLSSMQGFVSIRLIDIAWPPIVLNMFDFTRLFTFNFDIIRPECTVDYSPLTKLIFVLIGPFACALIIIFMIVAYTLFKCRRISLLLQDVRVQSLLQLSFRETFVSVAKCLLTSAFSLKFSNIKMMRHGALWNALDPNLAQRSNTLVLQQKVRRGVVLDGLYTGKNTKRFTLPNDWIQLRNTVSEFSVEEEFLESAKRFRLLLASALSIFLITFQGSVETALSTFDCKEVSGRSFLRLNPKVECEPEDLFYSRMVTCSVFGLVLYCLVLPCIAIVLLRSRWCRGVYLHNNVAYSQIFGFLTSMYSKSCYLWEIVGIMRKVIFVSIPILVSREVLVQSTCLLFVLIVYTFIHVKMQPMATSTLNQIEFLSCVSVIVGAFASVFFTVEYQGQQLLVGLSRDLAGLALVLICGVCSLASVRLMYQNYTSKSCDLVILMSF